jgi:hypothetical protein
VATAEAHRTGARKFVHAVGVTVALRTGRHRGTKRSMGRTTAIAAINARASSSVPVDALNPRRQ